MAMYAGFFQVYEVGQANLFYSKAAPFRNFDQAVTYAEEQKRFSRDKKFVVCELKNDGSRGSIVHSTG